MVLMKSLEEELLNLLSNNDYQETLLQLFEKTKNKIKFYETLFQIVDKEPSLNVVEKILRFMSTIRPIPFAYEVLIEKLFHKNQKIRIAAAETLAIYRPDISEILIDKMKSSTDSIENTEVIWLLGKIGKKEDLLFLKNLQEQIKNSNRERKELEALNNAIQDITLRYVDLWFEKKERKN